MATQRWTMVRVAPVEGRQTKILKIAVWPFGLYFHDPISVIVHSGTALCGTPRGNLDSSDPEPGSNSGSPFQLGREQTTASL